MVLVAPTSVEHTSVPGLLATFLINGEAVPSYVNTEQKKVDKYPGVTMVRSIEAIPGANYSIKVETNADFESTCETLTVRVDIDGQEVGGWNCNLPNGVAHADGLNQKSLNGAEFFHKFRFASISKGTAFCDFADDFTYNSLIQKSADSCSFRSGRLRWGSNSRRHRGHVQDGSSSPHDLQSLDLVRL